MIHLYHGDGKGKTTAAMGLALRMAGRQQGVVIAQFLKGEDSGERRALEQLPQVTLLPLPQQVKFTFQLSEPEFQEEALRNQNLLRQAAALAQSPQCGLLVLDEICSACALGLLPLADLLAVLDQAQAEVVLTGRDPAPELCQRADYITFFQKLRHPYDSGIPARPGIEY